MTTLQNALPTPEKPLRLWPGVFFAVVQCLAMFVLPVLLPEQGTNWFLGGVICGLGIVVWWLFFSRAPWFERLGAIVLMIVAMYGTSRILHVSVAKAGMGMLFVIYATPLLCLVFAAGVVASHRLSIHARRAVMVAVILLASGGWALVRLDGFSMEGGLELAWRWSATSEERLLAQSKDEPLDSTRGGPAALPSAPGATKTPETQPVAKAGEKPLDPARGGSAALPSAPAGAETAAEWPGFRGANRDGVVRGVRIQTDWSKSPPVEMWRRLIGPGWSSFAVRGDLLYTQEQRGEEEVVACYNLKTGKPVWMHRDATRFWEANAGPGPRGTPTLSNGRVYTFGATGILNALDPGNGAVVWSRNVAADADVKVPYWGFASSPLVIEDMVIVAAAGTLAAYDLANGKPRWVGPHRGFSYSSPQLVTIEGVAQVLLLSPPGAISVAPADGKLLWEHSWEGGAIVQPALTADGDVLINALGMNGGMGIRRLAVTRASGGWSVNERWTSAGLKPYFNDFVVHKGHAFGFDGSILACIELQDGKRKWKGGRYGNGQLVLLPDQDLLLVLSSEGELALVRATPDQFTELARFTAIEGKTWNHPALAGDVLLVRNGQEMVAFRVSLEGR